MLQNVLISFCALKERRGLSKLISKDFEFIFLEFNLQLKLKMSTDANAHISIMFDRSRQARNRRKKRGEPEITLPDPNKGPSTLDLVFEEAKSREEKAAVRII